MVYKIELKSLKIYEGMSEETTCFQANIYIDGKKVGDCNNNGRGGNTFYRGSTPENNELIRKVEEWCEKNPVPTPDPEYPLDTLESRIDYLVYQEEKKKQTKKLEKKMLTNLLFTKQKENEDLHTYEQLGLKGKTVQDFLNNSRGRIVLKQTIEREVSNGYRLLNTNIPKDL